MNGTHFCWKAPELVLISLSLDETKYAQMHFQTKKKLMLLNFMAAALGISLNGQNMFLI